VSAKQVRIVEALSSERVADVRELAEEYVEFIGEHWPEVDRAAFAREIDTLGEMYEMVLVALVDGEPAACVMLRSSEDVRHAAEVRRMYVRPAHRRLGVAKSLMTCLEGQAVARGYDRLILVAVWDFTGAVPLYESLGYEHVAPYRRSNMPSDAVSFMAKWIAAPVQEGAPAR
jgi:putative acetyltransferase